MDSALVAKRGKCSAKRHLLVLRISNVRIVLTNLRDDFVERYEMVSGIDRCEELVDDGADIEGALVLHVVKHNLLILCIVKPISHTAVNLMKELCIELLVVDRCGAVYAGARSNLDAYETSAACIVVERSRIVGRAYETGISTTNGDGPVVWNASLHVVLSDEILDDRLLTLLETVKLIDDDISHRRECKIEVVVAAEIHLIIHIITKFWRHEHVAEVGLATSLMTNEQRHDTVTMIVVPTQPMCHGRE